MEESSCFLLPISVASLVVRAMVLHGARKELRLEGLPVGDAGPSGRWCGWRRAQRAAYYARSAALFRARRRVAWRIGQVLEEFGEGRLAERMGVHIVERSRQRDSIERASHVLSHERLGIIEGMP